MKKKTLLKTSVFIQRDVQGITRLYGSCVGGRGDMASVGVSCHGGGGGGRERGEEIGMRGTTPAPSLSNI